MYRLTVVCVCLVLVLGLAAGASADVPRLMNIQGILTDDTGVPIADGTYKAEFYIYTDSVAGDLLWSEAQNTVVQSGLFTVRLGQDTDLADSIFSRYTDLFVTVVVEGYPVALEPRIRLTTGPFAFHALTADTARFATSVAANGWVDDGVTVRLESVGDQVGIGTVTPGAKLHVLGSETAIIRGHNEASSGSATGVSGSSASTSGRGLMGSASAGSGSTCGVEGYAVSPDGHAFYGFNEAESGNAYVFFGENHSPDGIAIYGTANADDPLTTGIGVYGRSRSDYDGTGVYGEATNTGTTYGVRGVSAYGIGVRGEQTQTGNHGSLGRTDEGVYGRGFGGVGDGVHGVAAGTDPADFGAGVYGSSVCPSYGAGVLGVWAGDTMVGHGYGGYFTTYTGHAAALVGYSLTPSSGGTGTYGYAGNAVGDCYGLHGEAACPDGRGVYGNALDGTGVSYGVYGETVSPDGYGVYGSNTALTHLAACAVRGERLGKGCGVEGSGGTRGVYGHVAAEGDDEFYGVYGEVTGTGSINYGVYGEVSGGFVSYAIYGVSSGGDLSYAGAFIGDVEITGTLNKGAGAFKIDHPLDPEGKYLCHSFVESPDMKNIYDGVVLTDDRGYATITLPEWFEALNRDFRYQLTVLDEGDSDEFVMAKVVRKIRGNSFTIRTSAPRTEVSWQATGIRHDRYAEANPIPVEIAKTGVEAGSYLYPEVWGKPIDLRLDHVRRAALARPVDESAPIPSEVAPAYPNPTIERRLRADD